MKTPTYFCYISIIFAISTSSTNAYPKSSSDNRYSKDNEANFYPTKRKAPNPEPPSFVAAHQEQPDFDSPVAMPSARFRRVGKDYDRKSQVSLEKELDLKRTSLMNGLGKRADRLYKRDLRPPRREDGYGIVYGNGRPIGILQPFPQAYELSPMYNAREGIEEIEPLPQVNPRSAMDMLYTDRLISQRGDWENNENGAQDSGKFGNDKFPAILNDYKLANRLNNNPIPYNHNGNEQERTMKLANANNAVPTAAKRNTNKDQKKENLDYAQNEPELISDNFDEPNKAAEVKRSTITNDQIDQLKSALNRMQNPGPTDKVEEIEDNLRDILSDMGLIEGEYKGMDSYKNKRENDAKRDVDKEDENLENGINKIELVKATHEAPPVDRNKREDKKEPTSKNVDKDKTESVPDASLSKEKEAALQLGDNKAEVREIKIGEDSSLLKSDTSSKDEIKRDAKINVANYQSEGDAYIRSKRQESNDIVKGLEKSGDLTVSGNKSPLACSGNESEMEKKRNKDQTTVVSISDKVKREDAELEYQKEIEKNIQAKIDAIKEQVKREIEALKTKATRQKRDVNTLLTEESSDLDPQKYPDQVLEPHIRRRRNLEYLESLKRTKRGLPDFSNLKDIDSGDYLDLVGEKQRNQRQTIQDYEMDPQENKFLPEALSNNGVGMAETKRSSNGEEGLPSAETVNLDVNSQDESNFPNDDTNIQERSVNNNHLLQTKSSAAEENLKQPDVPIKSSEPSSSLQEVKSKSNDEISVQKRGADSQIPPDEPDSEIAAKNKAQVESKKNEEETANIKQRKAEVAEIANIHKVQGETDEKEVANLNQIESKTRDVEETANLNQVVGKEEIREAANLKHVGGAKVAEETVNLKNPDPKEDEKSKREVTVSAKSDRSTSESTEDPTLNQKKETKRSIEDAPLNSNSPPQPDEQDLQEGTNSRRMRRQIEEEVRQNPSMVYGRRKRANAVMPYAKSSFFPYRAEEENGDDDGDEFDEDSFEDRNLQKRDAGYNTRNNNQYRRSVDYQQDYAAPEDYSNNNYQPVQKRSLAGRYVANENADVYENPNNYLYRPATYIRRKRQDFDQLASLHGGGPMLHHLAAVRERSMQQLDDDYNRNKRNFNKNAQSAEDQKSKDEPESIADLSASDLFGALPQSYDGNNLLRFKRIRREVPSSTEKT